MNVGMILAIVSGFLWSFSNIIDKTIVTKHFTNPKLIFIPLSSAYFIIGGAVLLVKGTGMSAGQLAIAAGASLAYMAMNVCYFYAAKREEISRIVPLFALSSVFVLILGAIFLHEVFAFRTYAGIGIIVVGSILIMLRSRLMDLFRSHALGLMIAAAVFTAIHAVLIKYLTNDHSYWTVFGWIAFLDGIIGLSVFSPQLPKLRSEIARRGWRGVQLVLLSDGNGTIASLCFTASASLWYVSLANAVSLVQYLFVFIWTIILSRFRPALLHEPITRRIAFQKILAIGCIVGGVLLVS
ncbi:MAG: DMT family transporter [Patescibacteria group bacterium]